MVRSKSCYRPCGPQHKPNPTAICVQNFDDSQNLAIRISYRGLLRSSSMQEPRHPLSKQVSKCNRFYGRVIRLSQSLHLWQPTVASGYRSDVYSPINHHPPPTIALYNMQFKHYFRNFVAAPCNTELYLIRPNNPQCRPVVYIGYKVTTFNWQILQRVDFSRIHHTRVNLPITIIRRDQCSYKATFFYIFMGSNPYPKCVNDPSAGSPTETLLRLLLPLNNKIHYSSRMTTTEELPPQLQPHNPNISSDHSIGRSDGRCVQRAGTQSAQADDLRLLARQGFKRLPNQEILSNQVLPINPQNSRSLLAKLVDPIIVARVRPRTSKGITDLLLPQTSAHVQTMVVLLRNPKRELANPYTPEDIYGLTNLA
ncbi:MAG: hypothetical protein EZS28_006848 [Streblomastix strix]|uniref:Uncharacterized protein n=1 Tax=Streblomastix strix TaxID=222440 RepID=A0A5J4WRT0_9EUKA|nr:MAG: hypothetical protein EZS28_006848 [Streblomastix strix]